MRVVIIGGGIMGTSVAVELALTGGVDVTVLERSVPGAEASTAAGGMIAPQLEATGPGAMLDLCLRSRGMYPAWVKQIESLSGTAVGYLESGVLQLAFTDAEAHSIDSTVAWQKAASLRSVLLTGDEARTLEPGISPNVIAAGHYPDDHQVDNRRLMHALSMAAARAGAKFRTGHVRGVVEQNGRAVGVDVEGETLAADVVVLAAGSWSGLVAGSRVDPRHIKPVRGQMVELQLRLPPTKHIVKSPRGYLVPRADGRVVVGSTMEMVGYDKSVTADGMGKLLTMAMEAVPALAQASVTGSWAGLRPWTEDKLPILGEGPLSGLLMATGHFRNGILLAPVTAKLIGQLARGEKPVVDPRPFRYQRFPS